jgi:hypothetical protein
MIRAFDLGIGSSFQGEARCGGGGRVSSLNPSLGTSF